MKNCPICNRNYDDQIHYCTRDGTKLEKERIDSSPGVDTKEIKPIRVSAMKDLTQSRLSQYASSDRRLIATIATLFVLVAGGLGLYGLSISPTQSRSAPSGSDDQVAATGNSSEDRTADESQEESGQRIELSSTQKSPVRPSQAEQRDEQINSDLPVASNREGASSDAGFEQKGNGPLHAGNAVWTSPQPPPLLPVGNNQEGRAELERAIAEHHGSNLPVSIDKVPGSPEESSLSNPPKPSLPSPEPPAEKPRAVPRQTANITVTVTEKSRFQDSDGYVYEFGLVLQEVTNTKIQWQYIRGRKASDSGKTAPINAFIPEQKPNTTVRYFLSVKMDGDKREDLQGQLNITLIGVNENGIPVEFRHTMSLDDSFPSHSRSRFRFLSLFKDAYVRFWPF